MFPCCNNCGGCGCGNRCRVQWVCYCSRWVEMPMQIVHGPGVTQIDVLEETNTYLESIAASLERCCPRRRCGNSCGSCMGGCGC